MSRLSWSSRARQDLFDIAAWYDEVRPGLGQLMLERVIEAPTMLLDHPRLGAAYGVGELRKWGIARTPFVLLYRVTRDGIDVARVRHGATDWRVAP